MPSDHETLDLILRAMRVCHDFGNPPCDVLWWRCDADYAPVTLMIGCNDLFFWGVADCEEVNATNIDTLEQALQDMQAIDPEHCDDAHLLFCCRMRHMRPQQPYYQHIPAQFHALFDACGPERNA